MKTIPYLILALMVSSVISLNSITNSHAATTNSVELSQVETSTPAKQIAIKSQPTPSSWSILQSWLRRKQAVVSRTFSTYIDKYQQTNDISFAIALILASLLYGLVHAAGPGHGKIIISSYVLANNQTMRRGIILAFLSALAQGTIAVLLVGAMVFLFQQTGTSIKKYGLQMTQGSYLLVIALGSFMFLSAAYRRFLKKPQTVAVNHNDHSHNHDGHHHNHHDDDCGCGHSHMPDSAQLQGKWDIPKVTALVLSVGLRPCTGALYVLAFALIKGVFWIGAMAVYAMALGTAVTISLMTMAVVGGRNLAFLSSGMDNIFGRLLFDIFTLGGALIITAFGVILFLNSLSPASPF